MKRLALLVSILVAVVVGLGAVARETRADGYTWQTVRLTWNNVPGTYTRNFTASITDTAFLYLPKNIAWEAMKIGTATTWSNFQISFAATGAAVANADTVHYIGERKVGGIWEYHDCRDETADAFSSAILTSAASSPKGKVFNGLVGVSAASRISTVFGPWGECRLKVHGDPNGALNGLAAEIYVPIRDASR